MSKKQYTDTFSNIHPSDETIERIMSMTNKKHFTGFSKTLVALVAVISILCSIGLVANAATDGAVAETVSEVFEAVSNKVTILINGKETEAEIDVSEKTNSDGEKYYEAEKYFAIYFTTGDIVIMNGNCKSDKIKEIINGYLKGEKE